MTGNGVSGHGGGGSVRAGLGARGGRASRRGGALPGLIKEAGRPEAARPLCPGEETDQKPSVMPVTKPVPSFLPPVTFLWLVVSSTVKTELFHATPGARL